MKQSEANLQFQCYQWFHNKFTNQRGLLCCNNNVSFGAKLGNKMKALGNQPGRADMVLYWKGSAYHIELKLPDAKQQPVQVSWQSLIESQGFKYYLIFSLKEFQDLICSIII